MFKLQQKSTGLFMDAYENRFFANRPGFEVVLRPKQPDYSQAWVLHQEPNGLYSVTQAETGRFMDAYENNPRPPQWTWDHTAVTRLAQESGDNLSQRWIIYAVPGSVEGSGEHFIKQASTEFFLDGYSDPEHDYQVCLRPNQTMANATHDPSQIWILTKIEDLPDLDGIYIFRQKDTDRLLDGHQNPKGNFEFITKDVEFSPTQHFVVRRVMGEAYTIIQESSGRFMDAYETSNANFKQHYAVVGRAFQNDDSQKWFIEKVTYNEFRIMHHDTGRMLTAYEDDAHDWMCHTMDRDELEDEIWKAKKIGEIPQLEGIWTIQQKSSGLYLDAYPTVGPYKDGLGWEAVFRPKQNDTSQHWIISKKDGEVYEVKQVSTGKCLDAIETGSPMWNWNFSACIRDPQNNPSQFWYFQWRQENEFTIRQHGNTRYLDAWPDATHDFMAVTREYQFNDDSQIFQLTKVGSLCVPMANCLDTFQCGAVDDGCGGKTYCGPFEDGHCPQWNIFANHSYDCVDHTCVCAPKTKCDKTSECGWEDDGCGGKVICGHQGNCTTKNPVSLQPDKCLFDPNNFTITPPLTLTPPVLAPNNNSCICVPKVGCNETAECGEEDDGCGGIITCNAHPKATIGGNCSAPQHVCAKNNTCECIPKTVCDVGNVCGFQDDGCGGTIPCGDKGNCTNGTNFACNHSSHECVCMPKQCGEDLCGILPDDGCGKEINCGGCQVANKMCNNEKHKCEIVPSPPCPSMVCQGPHPGPGPGPAPGPAPKGPAPGAPGPAPKGPGKGKGKAPAGAPGPAPKGPAPAPGPDVLPPDVPKNLAPARAAAANVLNQLATAGTAQQQEWKTAALQMPQAKRKLNAVGLNAIHSATGLAHLAPIPHNGNTAIRNALPNAERIVAEEAVLATNDTLWSHKPFWASLEAVHTEQDRLRAEAQSRIDAVVQGFAWDAEKRAETATQAALANMPPAYLEAGMKRLKRTLYDRITRHVPGAVPMPASAPSPHPADTTKTPEGDADSDEIASTMKKVSENTLNDLTAEIGDTKRWMNVVADQYTVDATREATIAAWPASRQLGQQLETQLTSGPVSEKAQEAYIMALNSMEAAASAAAKKPADVAAYSVAPEAVHMAAHVATHSLSGPIARESILNAQHVLGSIATGVVVDQLDSKVQEIKQNIDVSHHIDKTFRALNQSMTQEFSKLAAETANTLVAQMKAVQGVMGPGPSPAPVALPPAGPAPS